MRCCACGVVTIAVPGVFGGQDRDETAPFAEGSLDLVAFALAASTSAA
jgi:hypothetical protein